MALNPPTPGLTATKSGLRRIFYDARSAAKIALVVQPGDELEVSDDVAAQLLKASPQFKSAATSDDTGEKNASNESGGSWSEPEQAETPKPRKRAAKKKAAAKSDD